MKITAKTRYALRTMLDIAIGNDVECHGGAASGVEDEVVSAAAPRPRTIRQIAQSQGISEKFISRIVVALRRAGLIRTVRGVQGGLMLARPEDTISLLDVMQATEGPVALIACLARPRSCRRTGRCGAESVWRDVNNALVEALRGISLAEVVQRQRRFLPPREGEPEYMI